MRPSTLGKTAQRQLEGSGNATFKGSMQLHMALTREYKRPEDSSASVQYNLLMSTGKESVKQARLEKQVRQVEHQLASEVASLPKWLSSEPREQTVQLIARQKESRRDRHIKLENEFEKWVNRLSKNLEEAYKDIKRDIHDFFHSSDTEINAFYSSLSDQQLVNREIDFVDELKGTIQSHKQKRDDKISNLAERLAQLEKEREKSLELFCQRLQDGLVDVAFELLPAIQDKVEVFRTQFKAIVEIKQQENSIYVTEVNEQQISSFVKYEEELILKGQKWRDLKNYKYLSEFNHDIQQLEFVYPTQRVQLYENFRKKQNEIHNERERLIDSLIAVDMKIVTKAMAEKWIESMKSYNENASQIIDVCVNELVEESKKTYQFGLLRFEHLKEQLLYAAALPDLEPLLDERKAEVDLLNTTTRSLLDKAIKYYEELDQQEMDVVINIGTFYTKIGQKNDEYKTEMQLMHHNYRLMQAHAADKSDDHVAELKAQLQADELRLKESLHHPRLEENFLLCEKTLLAFQEEYKRFYEDNCKIVEQHPDIILSKHRIFEKNMLGLFELQDPNKEALLIEKFKKIAEHKAKFQLAKEEYTKKIEEDKAIEEAKNKKGAKAPPKKDPKKYQQELEERFKVLTKEFILDIQKYHSPLNQEFVAWKSIKEIVRKLFVSPDDIEGINTKEANEILQLEAIIQQQNIPKDPKAKPVAPPALELPVYNPEEDVPELEVDHHADPPVNVLNKSVLDKVHITVENLVTRIESVKEKILKYMNECLQNQNTQAKSEDDEFLNEKKQELITNEATIEPARIRIRDTIQLPRASQITIHKKRYERYAKQLIERIDGQTEEINFLLEGGLLDMKEYLKDFTSYRQGLPAALTLAKLQGIQNTAKENYFKFGEKITDLEEKLIVLANRDIDFLLQKNLDFMRDCKLFQNGGEYSAEEIQWYQQMMDEHNATLNRHKQQRNQKITDLKKILSGKRQEQLDKFEAEYAVAVEDLAAKDGTGKKYGKPKRIAQEKLRTEMTKCEKAQESINDKIAKIKAMNQQPNPDNSLIIAIRKEMMAVLVCIKRYAQFIEALKPDNKVQECPRITFKLKFDTLLEQDEAIEDKKILENDLESIGPLYYSGEKKFTEATIEIEKVIKEEAQKIYADKPKFLTGNDKIPDYLRSYIENMQRNTYEYRISAIRDLRNSCEQLSEMAPFISKMLLGKHLEYSFQELQAANVAIWNQFKQRKQEQETIKEKHQRQLRPNLGNPQLKDELDDLLKREDQRYEAFIVEIGQFEKQLLDANFLKGEYFLKGACQNFEFLLLYFDALVLFEDFISLPGDEQIVKKHQNLKVSLRQKQSGLVVDTNSERSLSKTWDPVQLDLFKVEDRCINFTWMPNLPPAKIDPKDNKKDNKKPPPAGKAGAAEVAIPESNTTIPLKSFKTGRQKSAKSEFFKSVNDLATELKKSINYAKDELKTQKEREMKFQFKWEQCVKSL